MDEISSCVASLLQNDTDVMEAAVDILIKIADNILREPDTPKYRSVNLSSRAMERTLLPAVGALEVLFLMGFQEDDDQLVLPKDDPLEQLRMYRDQLVRLQQGNKKHEARGTAKPHPSSPLHQSKEGDSDLRGRLVASLGHVVVYESAGLQEKAREAMPIQRLHQHARDMMAVVNKDLKDDETPLDFQDCVLRELLTWFRGEFFQWFDAPTCPKCQQKMAASGSLTPTQEHLLWGGSRVEGYSCKGCGTSDSFVRYNHPGKLLETRKGRCGEWANCFTLLCRTLGMDARYVLDFTDHVWMEVYSQSQRRWVHVDCCEGKMDTPLMYEAGWGKKLTYVFAFSKDEVVDITWRYTNKQREVLRRRKLCSEAWLVRTLMELNKERQSTFTPEKRQFLEHRLVTEVAGFFAPPRTLKDSENEGRSSGSLAWRLARGETQTAEPSSSHTFRLTQEEQTKREFVVKYSAARDQYIRVSAGDQVTHGWQAGVVSARGVFRKHESDWKTVYLARTEGSSEGEVQWCVDWSDTQLKMKSVLVVLQHTTYEDGCVAWQVCVGDRCIIGPKGGVLEVSGGDVSDAVRKLEVSVVLTKGQGDVGWQHAQLFRQSDHLTDQFPFLIHIKFE